MAMNKLTQIAILFGNRLLVAALREMLQISAISSNNLTKIIQGRIWQMLQHKRFSSVTIQSITLFEAVRRTNEKQK